MCFLKREGGSSSRKRRVNLDSPPYFAKVGFAVEKVNFWKIEFAEVGVVIVRMRSPKLNFSVPNADFACCAVAMLGDSVMEEASVIVRKTDSATAVDLVVDLDFPKVCFVSVRSDSVKVHFVKSIGSATVGYAVAKADLVINGLGTEADSEKLMFANARRFD